MSHVAEPSAVCKMVSPTHGVQGKGQEINYGLNEAKIRPQMVFESQCINYCEKNNIFPLPQLHPLEKSPVVHTTCTAWGSAEGSHPTSCQAIIQNANPPLTDRARIVTQVK